MAVSNPNSAIDNRDKIFEKRPLIPRYSTPRFCIKTVLHTNFNTINRHCENTPVIAFLDEFFVLECDAILKHFYLALNESKSDFNL